MLTRMCIEYQYAFLQPSNSILVMVSNGQVQQTKINQTTTCNISHRFNLRIFSIQSCNSC